MPKILRILVIISVLVLSLIGCQAEETIEMAVIDIGAAATDRGSYSYTNYTIVGKENPANDTGTITSVEIWAASNLSNCEVATFYVVTGNYLSTRDTATIGAVTAGGKQTFPVNLDVVAGDYLGVYFSSGEIEEDTSGDGFWRASGDLIPCTGEEFATLINRTISLYGTGPAPQAVGGASMSIGGSLIKKTSKNIGGDMAIAGILLKQTSKSISGAMAIAGGITYDFLGAWKRTMGGGVVNMAGGLRKRVLYNTGRMGPITMKFHSRAKTMRFNTRDITMKLHKRSKITRLRM